MAKKYKKRRLAGRCRNGHEYTAENTRPYRRFDGETIRICRTCQRNSKRKSAPLDAARYALAVKENPEGMKKKGWAAHLRHYLLTPEQYEKIKAIQGGVCALCKKPSDKNLCVDHDHACCPGTKSCGKCRRMLLCHRCNTALGLFMDDEDLLLRAAAYVNAHKRNRGV